MRRLSFLFIFLLHLPLFATSKDVHWRDEATHVVGGGDHKRKSAIARLERSPNLDAELREALSGPDRFLALDVIAALKRTNLIDDIIESSSSDKSGFTYLTLNTFIDSSNVKKFADLYLDRLTDSSTNFSAKVILLDTLSRMRITIDTDTLSELLFEDESPEVRSAALSYVRHSFLNRKSKMYLDLLQKLFASNGHSEQMKIQALFFYSELSKDIAQQIGPVAGVCPSKTPAPLKSYCSAGKK